MNIYKKRRSTLFVLILLVRIKISVACDFIEKQNSEKNVTCFVIAQLFSISSYDIQFDGGVFFSFLSINTL